MTNKTNEINENEKNIVSEDNEVQEQQDEIVNDEIVDILGEDMPNLDIDALAQAEKKAEENWNLYLSARAEADNIRKRAERDVSKAHKYALEKFIPELLAVKDSLELGTKAARESATDDNEQLGKFLEGSDMTINLFNDVLSKFGVVMIDPQNEIFNPEFHQAMTMIPNAELPNNTVMEVVQKGYVLNKRLVRPAMVIVSKKD